MKVQKFKKGMILILVIISFFYNFSLNCETRKQKESFSLFKKNIKKILIEKNIPGMAIAIVKNNEVVFKHCFGMANIEKNIPVDENTLFPIGSSTKPFTSTLISMLVSDKKMSWEDPITKFLPEFKLTIDSKNKNLQVTLRDLLSHRTGFNHMKLVQQIFSGKKGLTREIILNKAISFKPINKFRKKHNYSNISMLAAGIASGIAYGKKWDIALYSRLLEPLGMINTTTSSVKVINKSNFAAGYMNRGGKISKIPFIDLDCIAPAGGLISTLNDMIKWLKFINGKGIVNNKQLVNQKDLFETWKKHIEVKKELYPEAHYGLGWFITNWNKYKVVEHAGNSMGYSAQVAYIPELNISFVMLSNVLPNPLQMKIKNMVWKMVCNNK